MAVQVKQQKYHEAFDLEMITAAKEKFDVKIDYLGLDEGTVNVKIHAVGRFFIQVEDTEGRYWINKELIAAVRINKVKP